MKDSIRIEDATEKDIPLILSLIRGLSEYERLAHECVATEDRLRETLFGKKKYAEVIVAYFNNEPAGFALFFHNYSTFLARPGIYLEDLFVIPSLRGKGIGKRLLIHLAKIATERNCGRLEWAVLKWNESAIKFYQSLGGTPQDDWTVFRVTGDALGSLAKRK